MNQVPTKIVLKSTTRMSLNDRFSNIVPNVQSIRANMASEHQVSSANRRLAQQLSNRPGISQNQAANMMYNNNNNMMMMRQQGRGKRGSPLQLQQRVGKGNVKARLSLPANRGQQQQQGGRGGRGGRGGNRGGIQSAGGDNYGSWTVSTFKPRGRGVMSARSPRTRGGPFRGGRGQQQYNRDLNDLNRNPKGDKAPRFQGRRRPQSKGPYPDRFTGQASPRGGARGRGQSQRGAGNPRGGWGGRARGFNRGGRGMGRGASGRGGRGGGNNKPHTSVEELDNQLDKYMSKSKSALDSELDSYMAQVSTD